MASKVQKIPKSALFLGLAGLLPFFTSALLAWLPSIAAPLSELIDSQGDLESVSSQTMRQQALTALAAYGAVILSFLGGVRWGNLLNDKSKIQQWSPLTLSVVPSLIAWPALLLGSMWALGILAAGFIIQYAFDIEAVRQKSLPAWFGKLRTILTTGAILSLLAGLLAHAFLIP